MSPGVFLVSVVIAAVLYVYAFVRTASVSKAVLGARVLKLTTEMTQAEVYAALSGGAGKFKVEDRDDDYCQILLTTKPTLATMGFFYLILIKPLSEGGCELSIGIKSRVFQVGPLVTRAHRQCVDAVDTVLSNPGLATAKLVA